MADGQPRNRVNRSTMPCVADAGEPSYTPHEVLEQFAHYNIWIQAGGTPRGIAARAFVVLRPALGRENFLITIASLWNGWEESFRVAFNQRAAVDAPTVFGAETFWRRVDAAREGYLAEIRHWVVHFHQNDGVGTEDERGHYNVHESVLNALLIEVALSPTAPDVALLHAAHARLIAMAGRKGLPQEAAVQVYAGELQPQFINEAKRRLRDGTFGQIFRQTMQQMEKEGRQGPALEQARRNFLEVMYRELCG